METIKTSKNVEFDVIYDDGTRHRVREGMLFEVENKSLILHNGTDQIAVVAAAMVAAAEVLGSTTLTGEQKVALICFACEKIGLSLGDDGSEEDGGDV